MNLPPISVLVPTYGRTRVLSESIESFIRQDYAGACEMIVLNDLAEQHLVLDDSVQLPRNRSISITNTPLRFSSLGDKRNELVRMASSQLVAFWDDDDLYLPNALSRLVSLYIRRLQNKCRGARESHCWQMQYADSIVNGVGPRVDIGGGAQLVVRDSGTMWAMVVERTAILDVGGFPDWDRKQDVGMLNKLVRVIHAESNTPGIPGCIHRTTERVRATACPWSGPADNAASAALHASETKKLLETGTEPRGRVSILPTWKRDYVDLTTRAWEVGHTSPRLAPRPKDPVSPL